MIFGKLIIGHDTSRRLTAPASKSVAEHSRLGQANRAAGADEEST